MLRFRGREFIAGNVIKALQRTTHPDGPAPTLQNGIDGSENRFRLLRKTQSATTIDVQLGSFCHHVEVTRSSGKNVHGTIWSIGRLNEMGAIFRQYKQIASDNGPKIAITIEIGMGDDAVARTTPIDHMPGSLVEPHECVGRVRPHMAF